MRNLTNILLFVVALLTVVGLYLLRDQSFQGWQRNTFSPEPKVAKQLPSPPKPPPPKQVAKAKVPDIKVEVTVVPVPPRPSMDTIQVGMEKSRLWGDFGKPDAMTSSRDGDRLNETFIYLDNVKKATVVRLVNGMVTSVRNTRTVSPPLLVPQANGMRTAISLTM
ncbi:MAG TPA: hypothetical protein VEW69_11985 [Alphaproteobacteria bacterium]|nr:hypothetical protein [Alphaproteobacteria bacterium]